MPRTDGYEITTRNSPREEWDLNVVYMGKLDDASQYAQGLLEELREEYPRAQVAVAGKRVRIAKAGGKGGDTNATE